MPDAKPEGFRCHRTVPLPVPDAVVRVVQLFALVADQVVVEALVPVSVTVVESGRSAVLPDATESRWLALPNADETDDTATPLR